MQGREGKNFELFSRTMSSVHISVMYTGSQKLSRKFKNWRAACIKPIETEVGVKDTMYSPQCFFEGLAGGIYITYYEFQVRKIPSCTALRSAVSLMVIREQKSHISMPPCCSNCSMACIIRSHVSLSNIITPRRSGECWVVVQSLKSA